MCKNLDVETIRNTYISFTDAKKIRPLRHKMLREGKDFSTTSYEKDNESTTFHLSAQEDSNIICCATFYPEKTDVIKSSMAYRLRGMATQSEYSRQGWGTKIMEKAFVVLKDLNCDVLWCNARIIAVPFYKSLGFQTKGDIFNISDIGPHYYMYKNL